MPDTTREQFVERVRKALGRPGRTIDPPTPIEVDESIARLADDHTDLPKLFTERAEAVGIEVRPCAARELPGGLGGLLREIEAKQVVMAVGRLDQSEQLETAVDAAGVQRIEWRNDRSLATQYDVDAGVTDVDAVLAESGSLVCVSSAEQGRGLSLVPPIHVAIVRHRDILPDLFDYWAKVDAGDPAELPSSRAIITGPSKTADIEGVLVTGVHGPKRVIVLLVDEA